MQQNTNEVKSNEAQNKVKLNEIKCAPILSGDICGKVNGRRSGHIKKLMRLLQRRPRGAGCRERHGGIYDAFVISLNLCATTDQIKLACAGIFWYGVFLLFFLLSIILSSLSRSSAVSVRRLGRLVNKS